MSTRAPVFHSLAHLLRMRAEQSPDALAYCFLTDGEFEDGSYTYRELYAAARSVATLLRDRGVRPGDRALLLYPSGLDFVAAFFGALLARVIAVPAYPPAPASAARSGPRLAGIVADCAPAAVLCTPPLADTVGDVSRECPPLGDIPWIPTGDADLPRGAGWTDTDVDPGQIAFLQYTSGSTAAPRGVMVSHGNLLHNLAASHTRVGTTPDAVSLSWLPVIHDMGLIDGTLAPVFGGFPAYLMSPAAFLHRPVRWLEAITRYGVTNSGAPNFAYDLCVRRVTEAHRQRLDLSSWAVAYNGAEPVRADTLERFHAAFAPCGFRWRSFFPVYGLAEATLAVSSNRREDEPTIIHANADRLSQGLVANHVAGLSPVDAARATPLVAVGAPLDGSTVEIVDPVSRVRCRAGEVGEIWLASPSVAQGYWRRPDESAEVFGATLEDGSGPFLRTGDLGALRAGHLFVVGRIKDVLVLRGCKHHPHDVEATVEREHHAIRPGRTAAFAIEGPDGARVVVASEVDPRRLCPTRELRERLLRRDEHCPATRQAVNGVTRAVREAVARVHGIQLHGVVLLPPGRLPLTSSGKIRRHACAREWTSGTLGGLASWVRPEWSDAGERLEISA